MSSRRFMPALLLLFVGSGCAALIYEIVWFQLLQLVIGSSAISLGVLLGTFMGGMCLGSLLLRATCRQRPASAARVRVSRTGDRRPGSADPLRPAGAVECLYLPRHHRRRRPPAARHRRRDLSAATDAADGRHAAGDLALGEVDAGRHVVARILLRRQHRRRRARLPARGVLPASRLRHGDRDLRCRGAQPDRRRDCPGACAGHDVRAGTGGGKDQSGPRRQDQST